MYVVTLRDFMTSVSTVANQELRLVELYLFAAAWCTSRSASPDRALSTKVGRRLPAMIEIRDVSKWYGSIQVLKARVLGVDRAPRSRSSSADRPAQVRAR